MGDDLLDRAAKVTEEFRREIEQFRANALRARTGLERQAGLLTDIQVKFLCNPSRRHVAQQPQLRVIAGGRR
jgi:hypothetical protein